MRRTRILACLAAALGLELSAAALTSPLLGISRIAVRGVAQLPRDEERTTRASAVLPAGTNLLRAPLGDMERRMKALPWVRSARVAWLAPHALGVRIVPRDPAVILEAGGQQYEVDEIGVPIRPARAAVSSRLPHVEVDRSDRVHLGTPMHDESLAAAIKIYRDSPRQPMVRIAKIGVDHAGNMCLNMSDGIRVQLGQPQDLAVKMKYIQRVYQLEPGVCSRMIAINLSVPKQPACTLKSDVSMGSAGASEPSAADSGHAAVPSL